MQNCRRIATVWIVVLMSLVVATGAYADEIEKININTATAEQLTQLKGIGSSHAAGIIAYREKNGPFKNPADLINVPRIGQKTFEKNKDLIIIKNSKNKQAKK